MERKRVIVVGCNGAMGQIVCRLISESKDLKVFAGLDVSAREFSEFPVFEDIEDLKIFIAENDELDINDYVIVDFSQPECTMEVLEEIAVPLEIPMVIATTGFSPEQLETIKAYTEEEKSAAAERNDAKILLFMSSNMSYEIKLLSDLLRQLAPKLAGDYDIEIVETHHNRKADAPSGTAKTLAAVINDSLNDENEIIYGRTGKRRENQIGIASLRGGNVVGEHEVRFIGQSDELIITHRAFSRELFAEGALKAVRFLFKQIEEGDGYSHLYTMDDLI